MILAADEGLVLNELAASRGIARRPLPYARKVRVLLMPHVGFSLCSFPYRSFNGNVKVTTVP